MWISTVATDVFCLVGIFFPFKELRRISAFAFKKKIQRCVKRTNHPSLYNQRKTCNALRDALQSFASGFAKLYVKLCKVTSVSAFHEAMGCGRNIQLLMIPMGTAAVHIFAGPSI